MQTPEKAQAIHWSDGAADRIIRQNPDKEIYTVAAGITPSGTVHFGNFREVMTVDLVARALRKRNKKVRFIFSWDDYDTFRKIPKNMPRQEELKKYLYHPIVDTPDPYGEAANYAKHHENAFEKQLKKVGIQLEPLYQAEKYRRGEYAQGITQTLQKTATIKDILNRHRKESLPSSWLPISIYCENCQRDNQITEMKFDGKKKLTYHCEHCDHRGVEDITHSQRVKLPWRMDWPMRWAFEDVDFEPGGKDHSSQGGSFTTAKEIVSQVYGGKTPLYLQYEFISIKGGPGKMSSSSGEVFTVDDVLDIYAPEMIRWLFASYKNNVEFAISFDLDVIKIYEDYDRQERLAYGVESGNAKKVAMARKVFELSQLTEGELLGARPMRPSFRHLCNILQIYSGDIAKARDEYAQKITGPKDEQSFATRAQCALNWLAHYAPEDFKFSINKQRPEGLLWPKEQQIFFEKLAIIFENDWELYPTEKELGQKIYDLIHEFELVPGDIFKSFYQLILCKEKGPKLAGLLKILGKDKILQLLKK